MSTTREQFLQRVREAVAQGNRAGHVPPLESRGAVGYQGGGPDPVARFQDELRAAGGQMHRAPDAASAAAKVVQLIEAHAARRVLLGSGALLDALELPGRLQPLGVKVESVDRLGSEDCREAFFGADVGISGVDYLIAETGSLAILARPDQPRSLSLLPPIHIAVAHRGQVLPDLFDLFESRLMVEGGPLPSSLSIITGPSKTGDIELRLVTGVHGPGEVHVVLIDALMPDGFPS